MFSKQDWYLRAAFLIEAATKNSIELPFNDYQTTERLRSDRHSRHLYQMHHPPKKRGFNAMGQKLSYHKSH